MRLIDSPRLVHQFTSLERRTTRFGRDRVDHPGGGADDLANATSGALVMVGSDARPALIKQRDLLRHGVPVPMPKVTDCVAAILIVGADGVAATVYFSLNNMARLPHAVPLVLLDFEVAPLDGATIDRVFSRVEELARQVGVRWGAQVWVQQEVLQQCHLRGFGADVIPSPLLKDPAGLALSVAGHVASGAVKISVPAAERGARHPLAGAFGYRSGERADDPLRLALLAAIALALTPESSSVAPVLPAAQVRAA